VRQQTREAAARVLRERAEPTAWSILQAGIYAALGRSDALSNITQLPNGEHVLRELIQDGLSQCVELADHRWWLPHPPPPSPEIMQTISGEGVRPPLADRVELAVRDALRSRATWQSDDLLREVYTQFPDQLTPDRALVATAIQSYGVESESAPHQISLRPEDAVEARCAELTEIETLLLTSGAQLGFDTELAGQTRGVIWQQADRVAYVFTLTTTAEVAPLLRADASSGVLVLPGGRATLLQHKLARDPRLSQTAWQVLKFSSLRQVAQSAALNSALISALTLATFQLAFGLKPSIEQPAIQFELW
jgi:hypothetical protein